MMSPNTRKIAMFRHREREMLLEDVKKTVAAFEKDINMSLFPLTLRQVALFLRYCRLARVATTRLNRGIQKSLTFYQGRRILGHQADPRIENWKSDSGIIVGNLLGELGMK